MSVKEPKDFRTAEFKKLNAEWKKKLKASNFKDIEEGLPEDSPLPPSIQTNTARFAAMEATQEYYSSATEYLYTGKFISPLHKQLWELHAQGLSFSEIAEICKIPKSTAFWKIRETAKQRKDT